MDNLEALKRKEQEELAKIWELLKTMYRLSGATYYEPLDKEWDEVIQGKG